MVLQFSDLFRSILPIKAWRGGEFGGEWGEMKSLSCVQFFVTPWTVAHQAPLSMVFFRQGYWSGLPFPSPGDLPDPEIKPGSPALQADALPSEPPGKAESLYCSPETVATLFICYVCVCAYLVISSTETARTVAHEAPLSMGFSRQEYWSRVVIYFSRRSSWPRDQTWVSCIAGRFFTVWATGEAHHEWVFPY